ncbi:RNA polymerase II SUBUNIT A C-TERMINAL DOMAIN PHOSPHATASE [Salix koriyanagi]|uniref:RNA polymerase II subunit A C-terminal domain phosphatase SSU72 n=1 Tax=Salix koriyanagi TaxID=2511006 RepID=A0A9Q0SS65_9ROSI|nr:RNA polymerase II SUBUNIT A C-TERMINAL DOMAIN PHOSPHATASE [Salix koriyanagi]
MEAHSLLKRHGFDVSSYGTGSHVKLPGPSLREPNVYDFGTPYKQMFDDLRRKDPELYKRNGILPMLKRNSGVKLAPQRWQDNAADGSFTVVLTFEEKVFDMVLEEEHGKNRWTKLFAIPIDHDKLTNLKRVFFLSRTHAMGNLSGFLIVCTGQYVLSYWKGSCRGVSSLWNSAKRLRQLNHGRIPLMRLSPHLRQSTGGSWCIAFPSIDDTKRGDHKQNSWDC